ncbi:hypothetical protein V1L54_27605 [Streptomyces sp. TRM 70361]|uniref:hypothetical protein n=1 Tax=Streptomyces sp. TRM 70361 TaxID=3116553 RepID=UPI002E7ACDEC|nr:hypothetical protein [Streptomyces sp. TRM 70361]MEE1943125.1 hypothetical protein [Streptomyces sp. TRM 70361]
MTEQPENAAALTPAQRREILASDPETGELAGHPAVRAALVARGLAVRHGRVGAHYLTEAGRRVRGLLEEQSREAAEDAPGQEADRGERAVGRAARPSAFTAATGDEVDQAPGEEDAAARAAAVARAWAGVEEIRRVTGSGGTDSLRTPAGWERTGMVRAVSLALEAAGMPPSAVDGDGRRVRAGYRVAVSGEPGTVRVEWCGPVASGARQEAGPRLERCASLLAARGWEALLYRGPRGTRFLLVSPLGPPPAARSRP